MSEQDKTSLLRAELSALGSIVPLNLFVDKAELKSSLKEFEKHFKPYNPRKAGHARYGLSITSKDGDFSGIPDLDSLFEYNKLHGTSFDEPDFRVQTDFFKNSNTLFSALRPFHHYMGRSHILKFNKGGFFPPHRDLSENSFRLFISFCGGVNDYAFILDENKVFFSPGQVYFVQTMLSHSLFSFVDEALFALFNIDLRREAVEALFRHLSCY